MDVAVEIDGHDVGIGESRGGRDGGHGVSFREARPGGGGSWLLTKPSSDGSRPGAPERRGSGMLRTPSGPDRRALTGHLGDRTHQVELGSEITAFLEGGCALIVATAGEDGLPHAARGWGLAVMPGAPARIDPSPARRRRRGRPDRCRGRQPRRGHRSRCPDAAVHAGEGSRQWGSSRPRSTTASARRSTSAPFLHRRRRDRRHAAGTTCSGSSRPTWWRASSRSTSCSTRPLDRRPVPVSVRDAHDDGPHVDQPDPGRHPTRASRVPSRR